MANIDSVYTIILDMFSNVVEWLKMIPVFTGVSLYEFCLCIIVMSITVTGFVSIVVIGSTNYVGSSLRSEHVRRERSDSTQNNSR